MSKSLISIKEILEDSKSKLLEEKQYQKSHQNYLSELNQIYGDKIIDLKNIIEKESINKNLNIKEKINLQTDDDKIIYLNNEATEELIFDKQNEIIDLTEEIIEENNKVSTVKKTQQQKSEETIFNQFKLDQLENSLIQIENLNNKTLDIEKQNNLLLNKFDDLTNQNLDLSEKLDKDLDLKLGLASVKIEDQSALKIKLLEEKIINIQTQTEELKNDIANSKSQMSETINDISNTKNELLETVNSKIENDNEINSNAINDLKLDIEAIEPKILKNIEEKQRNSDDILNEFKEKFNEINHILEIQNNQSTLQKDFSKKNDSTILNEGNNSNNSTIDNDVANKLVKTINELKHYNDKNFQVIKEKISNFETQNTFEIMNSKVNELKDYNDKNFQVIKEKISNVEKKNLFETLQSVDLEKKFENSNRKFDNLYDAKEYVISSLANQTDNWIESNKQRIDEISKKLLED